MRHWSHFVAGDGFRFGLVSSHQSSLDHRDSFDSYHCCLPFINTRAETMPKSSLCLHSCVRSRTCSEEISNVGQLTEHEHQIAFSGVHDLREPSVGRLAL